MASAYGLSTLYGQGRLGAGVTVAIVEFETYDSSDISAFQACMGTDARVNNIEVETPTLSQGLESALDIEQVVGLAPQSTVYVYQGATTGNSNVQCSYKFQMTRPGEVIHRVSCPVPELNP